MSRLASSRAAQSMSTTATLFANMNAHDATRKTIARAELKESGFSFIGNEEYNSFECVLFPDNQLQILPYNRIVRDLNGLSQEEFLARVRESFMVTENAAASPTERGSWSMYLDGRW